MLRNSLTGHTISVDCIYCDDEIFNRYSKQYITDTCAWFKLNKSYGIDISWNTAYKDVAYDCHLTFMDLVTDELLLNDGGCIPSELNWYNLKK
jgi:hypothetical protein